MKINRIYVSKFLKKNESWNRSWTVASISKRIGDLDSAWKTKEDRVLRVFGYFCVEQTSILWIVPVVLTRSETGGHKPTLKCRSRTCAGKTRRVDAYDLISSFLLSVRQFHNGIEHPWCIMHQTRSKKNHIANLGYCGNFKIHTFKIQCECSSFEFSKIFHTVYRPFSMQYDNTHSIQTLTFQVNDPNFSMNLRIWEYSLKL